MISSSTFGKSAVCRLAATAFVSALLGATAVRATPVVFVGSSGTLGATASFDKVGTNLVLTLSNTGGDALDPATVLTTVFFNVSGGSGSLAPVSALIPSTSTLLYGTAPGGNVGGEWALKTSINVFSANAGISSTGLGVFPGSGNFNGPDLDGLGNGSPSWGLISMSDDPTTGNAQVTGSRPLIKNSVVFTMSGFTASLTAISNVSFLYGTSMTEPHFAGPPSNAPSVPEGGSTLVLSGFAVAVMGLFGRRFSRK